MAEHSWQAAQLQNLSVRQLNPEVLLPLMRKGSLILHSLRLQLTEPELAMTGAVQLPAFAKLRQLSGRTFNTGFFFTHHKHPMQPRLAQQLLQRTCARLEALV